MNRTELAKSGKYYTYGHYLDGNLIYIGEGKLGRAWCMTDKPYYDRRKDVEVRIFGIFDNKELAVFNEGLLIYQERMEGNDFLLNKSDYGSGPRGCKFSEETKQKMSEALTGETGEKNRNFKGLTVGKNKNNQTIVFCGKTDTKDRGFDPSKISKVILEKAAHHQGFAFTRTSDIDQLRAILDTADFIDEISRKRIEEFTQE